VAVFLPGFSERVFEFGFNAEFAESNKALLVSAPDIPTQNQEKYLGYDVLFELSTAGGVTNAVALQHKTVRKVDGASGTNSRFSAVAGLPYFAFRIDAWQFNTIESIASAGLPGVEFYYCIPRFTLRTDMNAHYLKRTVSVNSLWIDVAGAGAIDELKSHSIVFTASGSDAWVFSTDPKKLKVVEPRLKRADDARREPFQFTELRDVYDRIFRTVEEKWGKRPMESERRGLDTTVAALPAEAQAGTRPAMPPTYRDVSNVESTIAAIGELLGNYVGMTVLAEVPLLPAA